MNYIVLLSKVVGVTDISVTQMGRKEWG